MSTLNLEDTQGPRRGPPRRRRCANAWRPSASPPRCTSCCWSAGIAMVFPFLWMIATSLKDLPQLLQDPLSFWPDPWTWSNFTDAWNAVPFAQAYLNSIYIAVLVRPRHAGHGVDGRLRVRADQVPRLQVHLHRLPGHADDPLAGHPDALLPAHEQAGVDRLPPGADRPGHDGQPLRGVPDAPVRAGAAQGARGGRGHRRREPLAHLLERHPAQPEAGPGRAGASSPR